MYKQLASLMFLGALLFSVLGDRLGDVGISANVLRSLHAVDILFPFVLFLIVLKHRTVIEVLGTAVTASGSRTRATAA